MSFLFDRRRFKGSATRFAHFFFVLLTLVSVSAYASEEGDAHSSGEAFAPGEMILHHVTDDYVWHFFDGAVLPLPVILFTPDRGLEVFSSSHLYDHHEPVAYNGYKVSHGHLETTDPGRTITADLSITKNVASMFLGAIILLAVFMSVAKSYGGQGRAPRGLASFMEPIILFIRDDIAKPNIGPKYERYVPFLLTIFFFIWINNLLGLIPGGANLTGNITITAMLALITLGVTLFSSNKYYWQHIFDTPGVPWWLKYLIPIMPVVEVIGIFTKPFSLMVRLFANITAGHIIILSLFSLIFIFESFAVGPLSVAFATFMNFLELFVAILQAYIFTLLTAMYIGGAVAEHHHEHDDEAHAHHGHAPEAEATLNPEGVPAPRTHRPEPVVASTAVKPA